MGIHSATQLSWHGVRATGATLVLAATLSSFALAAPAYKGMSYTSFGTDTLSSNSSDQSLLNLSLVGTDTVAINFWQYQDSVSANSMAEDPAHSATMASVSHAIDTIHGLGMKVLLKPMVDITDASATWRAYADPSDKDQWFANYTNYIGSYADLAKAKGVELLSIGCEMNTLEQSANNARWSNLIANTRSRYSGKLTYSANWGPLNGNVGGYQNVSWWNQLDYIGIDAYFPIASNGNNNPTLAQLQSGWQSNANSIETWRANAGLTNRQVLFTEVGYQSADTAAQTPWGVDTASHSIDLQEQADSYNALLSVMSTKPWWDGAFWWSWEPNPYAGGIHDTGFTPQSKPAQSVLQQFYGGPGPPPPPHGATTQSLYSWEGGLAGWQVSGFNGQPASVAQSAQHATDGGRSLAVTQTGSAYSWAAGVSLSGDQASAITLALTDNPANYRIEYDVIYDTSLIPQASVSSISTSMAMNSTGGWNQVDNIAQSTGHANQTIHVSKLLSSWPLLAAGSNYFNIFFALSGNWGTGSATVFFDNMRLVNVNAPLTGDYNHDGHVDAADYTIWRDTMGSTTDLRADGNLNGVVDSGDYSMWKNNFGTSSPLGSASSTSVPEPATAGLAAFAIACCVSMRHRRSGR